MTFKCIEGGGTVASFLLVISQLAGSALCMEDEYARSNREPVDDAVATLSAECLAALRDNSQAIQTVFLKYSAETVRHKSPGVESGNAPSVAQYQVYFDAGRFYSKRDASIQRGTERIPSTHELSFDGSVFYAGNRRDNYGKPSVAKYLGDNSDDSRAGAISRTPCQFLSASGFYVPSTPVEWKASSIDSIVLHYLKVGKLLEQASDGPFLRLTFEIPDPIIKQAQQIDLHLKTRETRGENPKQIEEKRSRFRNVASLEPTRRVQLLVDPSKGYAITRRDDFTKDGRRIQSIEAQELLRRSESPIWLPSTCKVEDYVAVMPFLEGFSDQPVQTVTLTLEEISFERRSIPFAIEYGAGSVVADHSTEAARESPSGQQIIIVPEKSDAVRKSAQSVREGISSGRNWSTLIVALNLIVAAAIVVYLRFLRRK